MVFLYIEHVATCICLGDLEKRGFKMWKGTLFKRRARTTLPHQLLEGQFLLRRIDRYYCARVYYLENI